MADLLDYLNTHGGLCADNMRWCVQRAGAITTYIAVIINIGGANSPDRKPEDTTI